MTRSCASCVDLSLRQAPWPVRIKGFDAVRVSGTLVPGNGDSHHYRRLRPIAKLGLSNPCHADWSAANLEAPVQTLALAGHAPVAINLNQPGSYLTWNVFTISVANLVLIAVMVAIFGAALLLPFPRGRGEDTAIPDPTPDAGIAPGDERMWTARARRRALTSLPPHKLLPDRQPAYVASWVYVFGVASLAALAIVIVSGFAIAIGGPDWWHTNPVGHFFNSLHLWSVELFMALLVIHLWGKFWMAAWRGRRTLTWITGVVAFLASVVECFTGYLSQQNFDSQWIATNGKDAFNAAGVGAFFNLMNFGQMLMWH